MNEIKQQWLQAMGAPAEKLPEEPMTLLARYAYPDFDVEL